MVIMIMVTVIIIRSVFISIISRYVCCSEGRGSVCMIMIIILYTCKWNVPGFDGDQATKRRERKRPRYLKMLYSCAPSLCAVCSHCIVSTTHTHTQIHTYINIKYDIIYCVIGVVHHHTRTRSHIKTTACARGGRFYLKHRDDKTKRKNVLRARRRVVRARPRMRYSSR